MSERSRWLWRAVALIAAVAVVAIGTVVAIELAGDDDAGQRSSAHATREGDSPVNPPAEATPEIRAASRAARRFLAGYLPYSYGRAPASQIDAVATPLRRTLQSSPPRVPPAIARDRGRQPRLVNLELASSNGDLGVDLIALVDDGRQSYRMTLAVRPSDRVWLVTALS